MDVARVLHAFDQEMRRRPPVEPGVTVEDLGGLVRIVGAYNCIIYCDLDKDRADRAIAEQRSYFQALGKEVEWKVYGHDRPAGLAARLSRAGFHPDPPETLMVWDLETPVPTPANAGEIDVRRVRDPADLRVALSVSEEAFGPGHSWGSTDWASRLEDPTFAAFVAYRSGIPVGSARLELPRERSFASLWGGGTIPAYRGAGVFRQMVSVRAEFARQSGYRYITVDARETSRPILHRVGFVPLDSVTGWILSPRSA